MHTKRLRILILASVMCVTMLSSAGLRAEVVNFDDLSGYVPVPVGYAGLTWGGWWYIASEVDWPGQAQSSPMFIFNRIFYGDSRFIDFPSPVVFNGAWVATYYEPNNAYAVRFICYGGEAHDVLIGSTPWFSLSSVPAYLQADMVDVTRVDVECDHQGLFLLDDLTYNMPIPAAESAWGSVKLLYR